MFCADHQIELLRELAPNRNSLKSEDECRSARFAALDSVVDYPAEEEPKFNGVICCQHLDDCVESYLMNCFNGTPEYCPIPVLTARFACTVYRPFLLTRKQDLWRYAVGYDLMQYVVEDETNKDFNIRRNFVRHEVRPLIETRWVGLEKVVKKKILSEYNKVKRSTAAYENKS
tara:strand:- start:2936 stop:3454 length:519 start_codon:yes stop_codon:yes gene_type:complete